MLVAGSLIIARSCSSQVPIFGRELYIHSLIVGCLLVLLGVQAIGLGLCARAFGVVLHQRPGPALPTAAGTVQARARARARCSSSASPAWCSSRVVVGEWAAGGFGTLSEARLAIARRDADRGRRADLLHVVPALDPGSSTATRRALTRRATRPHLRAEWAQCRRHPRGLLALIARWQSFEGWVGSRSSAASLFLLGLAVFALQSVVAACVPGPRHGAVRPDLSAALELRRRVLPAQINDRGPLAGLGVGGPLELGGMATEVWLGCALRSLDRRLGADRPELRRAGGTRDSRRYCSSIRATASSSTGSRATRCSPPASPGGRSR